jgi:(p)ppGpp synthase/HD superfamily hydrolase
LFSRLPRIGFGTTIATIRMSEAERTRRLLDEPIPAILTERFEWALLYAVQIHGGETRKSTAVPYISHLMAVAATVLEYGGDEGLAIAALLHDAAEDRGVRPRLNDIRTRFGDWVALLPTALGLAGR